MGTLGRHGIDIHDPYCLFLLDTCSKQHGHQRVLDTKLFLATALRTQPVTDE